MGNTGSSGVNGRRRHGSSRRSHPPPPSLQSPQSEVMANRYVVAAATPYPSQFPNPPPYYGYYPAVPLPAPYDHHHRHPPHMDPNLVGGRYPYGPPMHHSAPYVEHQKAVTIRNDVNLKKGTLRVEPDGENPGKYLVAFTFDATTAGWYSFM
ncbi:unnamed protein product [Ilex paraguariensis]|uniref:RING-type E3 ubiquitin transferase n=1 Tax=Ilex paraguariensis TaxID=185542 RepID=A0ABC8UVM6_9AQUA